MDIVAPLVKTGVISQAVNMWLAVPIGFFFGLGLYHAGFTDCRKIAQVFYLKDVGVPVVMFSAIVTGMLGLWFLILIGFLDPDKMYFLPTYLLPMAVGGLLFGVGMVIGGFCPGTAAGAIATGRVDAVVFVLGFLIGSMVFGDLFPVWGEFYNSDYRGVYRLDELFGIELGPMILIMIVISIAGSLVMRAGQHYFWGDAIEPEQELKCKKPLVLLALVVGGTGLAFFPTAAYLPAGEPPYYLIPKEPGAVQSPAAWTPPVSTPAPSPAPSGLITEEGC
jgi:uncharacterized membrane protein YedE/YeeE